MTVKQRLKEYIKTKKISTREFCRVIGVSETYVNSIRTSIQPEKLIKITHAFPDLNTEWLLTGEGEMFKINPVLPPIERDRFVDAASDIFKEKLLDMFTKGEVFSAAIVWEQHRLILEHSKMIRELEAEVHRLKCELEQHKHNSQ